jgi:hypothetical protein
VEGRFGLSTPASTFSDHGAVSECYKSTKWPSDPTVVTFTAGSAGGFTDLTGFELKYDSTAEAEKCVTSSLVVADLGTASGLRLGLAQTEMQKILGPGKPSADEIRRWFYEGEVPVSAAEAKRTGHSFYDEFSGVIARFRDSKADCISVFQTQTY